MENTVIADPSDAALRLVRQAASPALCTVTQEEAHGGIARVSVLLWNAMNELFGNPRLISLSRGAAQPGMAGKARFSWDVARCQVTRRVDWLIFDHLHIAVTQNLIPARFRAPYAIFLHSIEAWDSLSPARERVLRQAAVRLANSHHTAQRIAQAHPDVGPIEVCHLALLREQQSLGQDQEAWPFPNIGPSAVLVVGRMSSAERYKGHDQLLAAWPEVKRSIPDAQLLVVGRGDDVPRLQAAAAATGYSDSILFFGRISDAALDSLYGQAAVFAMPSRCEGFGLVYLEAMSRRLPCIASVNDAAREVVEDGITGLLVEQSDVAALARDLIQLLGNPTLRREMGEAGWRRCRTQFSFDRFKQRFSEVMRPVIDRPIGA